MEAYIKNKNKFTNKSRYSKVIPHDEIKVDLKKYFGRDDENFIQSLRSDKDIEVKLIKTAGVSQRETVEKIESIEIEEKPEEKNE